MKTTLTRLFTVALLMMVSLGARAEVKVLFGEKGTEKFEGSGGTIEVKQEDSKDDKAKVKVYLTFTPKSGYTFDESTLEVYAAASPNGAFTRAPEIAGDPLKLTEEKADVPSAKRYSVDIDSNLGLWVKRAEFHFNGSKGDRSLSTGIDFSGIYYLGNSKDYPGTTADNFYLIPSVGCYYEDNPATPHLTTFKSNHNSESLWRIEKTGEYYYIISIGGDTEKYLTANPKYDGTTGNDVGRLRVHLEERTTTTLADDNLFMIVPNINGGFNIKHKDMSDKINNSTITYLDPAGGNYNDKNATSGRQMLNKTKDVGGTIGYWTDEPAARWIFEDKITRPTIAYSGNNITITYPSSATIYYTTNGDDPTKQESTRESFTGTSRSFEFTDNTVVKAAAIIGDEYSNITTLNACVHIGSTNKYLIQTIDCGSYYMVPPITTEANVTTTNIPHEKMAWYFEDAGQSHGIQFYYIRNSKTDNYLYCSGSKGGDNAFKINTSVPSGTDANKYKFMIVASGAGYNVIPMNFMAETTGMCMSKKGGNNTTNFLNLSNGADDYSRWKFITVPGSPKTQFDNSFASSSTDNKYYKIQNANSSFNIIPPTTSGGNATAGNNAVGNNTMWYFVPTTDGDDWVEFYHVRNGLTGEYLYFTGNPGDANTFYTGNSIITGNEDQYKFIVVKGADSNYPDAFNIIPKALKDQDNQANSSLNRNNTVLRTQNSRAVVASLWNLVADEDYKVAPPYITYDINTNQATITCTTPGATIYYTTDDGEPTTSSPNAISPADANSTASGSFVLSAGVKIIRAIAYKDVNTSSEASYSIPIQLTLNDESKRPYLIWNKNNNSNWLDGDNNPKPTFFMIPSDEEDGDVTVNTTTMPRPTMEWLFLNAAKDDKQYYTIKNNSSNGYLYYDENKDLGKKIYIKDTYDSNDDGYRFSIEPYYNSNTLQGYNIIPYGLTSGDRFVHKGNNNNTTNRVTLNSSQNGLNSLWFFALKSELDQTPPFVKSDNSATHYYKIESAESAGYCVVPPATGQTNVTTTNEASANMNWYLEVAQAETTTDWLTYYYIRNALTGEYLYFTGEAMINSTPVFEMRGSVDQTTDAEHYRYQFTWTKSPNTDNYYIVPRSYAGESLKQICTLYRDGVNLKTNATRANSTRWKFVESTFTCATPVITYSTEQNGYIITSETQGAKIYYTTGDNSNTLEWTEYTEGTAIPTPTTRTTIKAIAARSGDHSDKSGTAEFTVAQVGSPVFDYSAGNSISITCPTDGAAIYYVINGTIDITDPTNGTTLYEGPLTDEDGIVGKTISAVAVKPGSVSSAVVTSVTIVLRCATPVIKRGNDNASFTIECSFPTSGVTIKYTTASGSDTPADPLTTGTSYTGAVLCTFPITIRAIAVADGYGNSDVATRFIDEGLAEEDGVYIISSDDDFGTFVEMVNDNENGESAAHYKLTANVSASGVDPITTPFTGIFEVGFDESSDNYGNFYKISGLRHALFNTINGGTVRNVILDDVIINNQDSEVNSGHAGAICNEATGASRIYNCGILPARINRHYDEEKDKIVIDGFTGDGSTTGNSVGGSGNVGSIVGQLSGNSRVINCFSYANITGGSIVAGIVGNNATAITQSTVNDASMVVNCMFYGDITGGGTISPVYGGSLIDNAGTTSVNGYNYFRGDATFDDSFSDIDEYKRTWPANEEYLTRFEYYRSILNSNRQLCTYWVTDKVGTDQTAADTALIAKWVLDPSIAPYPILKKWGKYPSVINRDSKRIWDPRIYDKDTKESLTPHWVERDGGSDYHGKKLGTLKVTINAGTHHAGSVTSPITDMDFIIMDMDTLNHDFGYAKIQLPYYNELFGDPTADASQWDKRYGGNYKDYVVTGWDITSVTGGTAGTFNEAWEDGYNFADRKCTEKDKHRTFAQGGYYYVPEGVEKITITAHWGKAVYLRNTDNSIDRVNVTNANGASHGSAFTPAGSLPATLYTEGPTVKTSLREAIKALDAGSSIKVYDQAIVLVGNYQKKNLSDAVGYDIDNKWHPFTIMSADLDLDNEPDYCMQWQFRNGYDRPGIQPIRFDFLPIPELGLAIRHNNYAYSIGIFIPQGHFEITETAFMHTTQFEYDHTVNRIETQSPLILNGGHFEQIVLRNGPKNRTSYILMGGNFWIRRFTPGWHAQPQNNDPIRHCAVNAIGGDYPEFYLSGIYAPNSPTNKDNPHCYTNGGHFGIMAGAGYESVDGDVTFKIDHSVIREFYGGGINGSKPVTGSIDVTIDHSLVSKYCGGPKVGPMTKDKTVTTHATGSVFGEFYGGGNGGTSFYRENKKDNTQAFPARQASGWEGFGTFNPLNMLNTTKAYEDTGDKKGYHAEYEFEIFNNSNGNDAEVVKRCYILWAQFGITTTGNVSNTLTDCMVMNDFFGGGNLANVDGNVTSVLTNTTVMGSAFGGGFSASIPSFRVHDKSTVEFPYRDHTGTITKTGSLDYVKENGKDIYYTWTNILPSGKNVTTDNPTYKGDDGKWYCYTTISLNNLGTVSGKTELTINGDKSDIKESVYGGGKESGVDGNTWVEVNNGTIGTTGEGGATYGNVYGGGMGKAENGVGENNDDLALVKAGLVKGNTNVKINGGSILHNVYGGGAFGSVGTYTYDGSGNITGHTDNTGKAEITITGGTIGTTGKDNGMVFGSSRGDVDATDAIQDRLAWVHDTHVVIGTSGQGSTLTTPLIKGSVYGGGENGHTYQNAIVDVHSGMIGVHDTDDDVIYNDDSKDANKITYEGKDYNYPYRGNVYGGGCGTDKYYANPTGITNPYDGNGDTYNPLAGIVQGIATVNIDGGLVVHNVYGAGAMGSVGTMTKDNDGAVTITSGGTTTIRISGGTVGVDGSVDANGNGNGNVFGAARGDATTTQTDVALINTTDVTISAEADIKGSVYGGGEVGNVGTYTTDDDDNNNYPEGSGVCNVSITGGTIWHHVFGAGKGAGVTFKCEKAMVSTTSVSMSAGTVKGNVYGGGEVGRVEHNTLVTIGTESGGETLTINGSVFGAGKGLATHGYSALVRGNPTVTVQGSAHVGKSVYGGGEIASVGKYGLDAKKMPSILKGGGECLVTIKGAAQIGIDGGGDVFGAGKGVETPFTFGQSKRMTMYTNSTDFPPGATTWEYYETGSPFVWEYFQDETAYSKYLETLALATAPTVNIEGSANINGSVYGGGEKGITKGAVVVNIKGGTIQKDVYGGGALADTNTGNWSPNKYVDATLPDDASEILYTRTGEAEPYVYTIVDSDDVTESGTYYKTVGAWTDATGTAWKTTTVNLTGGTIIGDAYGGGLGQIARAASEGVTALDDIKAYVWGDVMVKLNEAKTAADVGCSVSRIFGCNNQNGTPKGKVKVYVSATQNKNKEKIGTDKDDAHLHTGAETGTTSTYDVTAVYGGGNLSPYEPYDDNERTEVYIDGCKLTSIKQVYGGGNAACAPATLVRVTGAYEIEELFGGGNGYDDYELYGKTYLNPGANVGYRNYTHPVWNDELNKFEAVDNDGTSTLEGRRSYAYGSGIATTEIIGGKIHFVYGGSNKKGNIRTTCKSTYEELDETCPIVTDETYGGGKDSPMDGMVDMGLGCVNNMEQTFGGSKNADVNSDIVLRITNGTYKQVFGGNNTSGAINGSITVEIKEEGCSPVRIGELYLGGYLAPYSVYGYETDGQGNYIKDVYVDENGNNLYDDNGEVIKQPRPLTSPASGSTPKKDPRIYVISASRIDNIFGGGYKATVVGNPHVNINMEEGKIDKKYNTAENPVIPGLHEDTNSPKRPYYDYTVKTSEPGNDAILAIGTIGNIYGGGNEADIIGNTHVEIGTGYWHNADDVLETIATDGHTYTYNETSKEWSYVETIGEGESQTTQTGTSAKAPAPARNAATITGNVFGGGKGKADTYECEKAMVGVADGQDSNIGNTSVIIGNGIVKRAVDADGKVIGGNVYGGGEVGRVEFNTAVTIGLNPDEVTVTSEPTIEGDVFGAGAGVETHGYSALVRGNASVTVQAKAQINGSVYGGGEKATVGKYWVKGVDYPSTLTPPDPPSDDILSDFMPYAPRSGGVCTVTVEGNAEIGDGTTGGHVFGAGKGVEPHWVYGDNTIDKEYWSRRMSKYDSRDYNTTNQDTWEYIKEYTQAEINDNTITKYVWEYFDTEAKYATFLETLALASETQVTIGETSGSENVTVNGSVYGGSENGFVQTDTDVEIQSTSSIGANVFGGGKGTETHDAAGRVKGNTVLNISGGSIAGNVYGGGELGHVGTFTETDGKYVMQTIKDKNGNDMNTGLCTVTIAGGKIGPDNNTDKEKGNVFGAGKGKDDTFKCEKAMTMNTNVSISAGTVNGNVYGGGEIGRVENDTEVTIGRKSGETEGNGTGTPIINGSVFGAGRGVATHGYSALVRGNTQVTVEGAQGSKVAENVYGGGEIASVGRYGLDTDKMPEILVDGGICTIKILGSATIGPENASDDKGNVFGAGKGVNPQAFNKTDDDKTKLSRRMTLYTNSTDFPDNNGIPAPTPTGSIWEYYETGSPFVWEYYQTKDAYSKYLETLALATQPHVIIGGNATVNGSVFGGGELGITKGSVYVNVLSGKIVKDVYGGGSLANTNTTSTWSLRDSEGKPVPPVNGVYTPDPTPVHPKTTVNLLGGKLRYAYGGGLGQLERAANAEQNITALADIPAKVFGNVKVNLNGLEAEDYDKNIHQDYAQAYKETAESPVSYYELKNTRNSSGVITSYATGAIVNQIFGCNNLNGSPQKHVKVHVFATQNADASHNTIGLKYPVPTDENSVTSSVYDVEAVYGGGNLAPYKPEGGTATTESTEVIIEGCDLTSIKQVYGGGNAASAPATNVTVNSAYEIEEVFGGGNGLDSYLLYGKTYQNPGANVGYKNYTTFEWNGNKNLYEVVVNDDADTKDERLSSAYVYGTGEASVNIYGGRIHRIFGGSNTLGNVRKTAVTVLDSQDPCLLDIDEAYGGGKSASMDAEAILIMACIPGLKAVYGGAQDADIQDDVVLTITNGTFNRVFGGNNVSGQIHGTITVNIEETGCKPVVIGQLYGGGNQAPYTAPWKDENDHSKGRKDGPTVNVKSFTSIGEVFGGGYGETAVVTGDTYVNVNVCKGKFASSEYTENTKTFSFSEYKRNKDGVGEESFMHNSETGERIVDNKIVSVLLPGHKANEIGAIKNVFGGGNAAKVVGNTNVNIGTEAGEEVYTEVAVTTGASVEGYYTHSENSYDEAHGTAVAGTTYYQKTVKGADIRGNVYGGGNNAEVTGDTNVTIGKKATP